MKKKICVVITARPSYSRIKTALLAIKEHPKLELQLVVAASALLNRFGSAVSYIENDGFVINERVYMVIEGGNLTSSAKTTGIGIMELSTAFDNLKPNMVVTIADRFETMATAIAASYMNIPLVHIQGGEVTGNIDEKVRHAISKLSDLHLVSTEDARNRLIRMGESPKNIFVTGCPSIDLAWEVYQNPKLDFDPYEKYGGVGNKMNIIDGYIVVMQHPLTTEHKQARHQTAILLQAIHELNIPAFWFWPNPDAGTDNTSNAIRSYRETKSPQNIHFFKGMEGKDFLKLLANSKCLVGNSSVGIRECSFLGVPAVNIGKRQNGRLRGMNILDTEFDLIKIKESIKAQFSIGKYPSEKIYGTGGSGKKIADLLYTEMPSIQKVICY